MTNRHIMRITVIVLIFLFAFGISKFLVYIANKNSDKKQVDKRKNLVLQSGIIGLCLGVGVGTALKDSFSETAIAILFSGMIGAAIGIIVGIIITRRRNPRDIQLEDKWNDSGGSEQRNKRAAHYAKVKEGIAVLNNNEWHLCVVQEQHALSVH